MGTRYVRTICYQVTHSLRCVQYGKMHVDHGAGEDSDEESGSSEEEEDDSDNEGNRVSIF